VVAGIVPPFEITEPVATRPRCKNYVATKQPFFGETHLHTGLSFDASIRFVETRPRDAYNFAQKKGTLTLPNPLGVQNVVVQIDRPLDWGAVTDHSEHFGEMGICKDFLGANAKGRYSFECQMLNGFYWQPENVPNPAAQRNAASNAFNVLVLPNNGPSSLNSRLPLCNENPAECDSAELAVWEEMQAAAEEAYDRTPECSFTSFNAYEVTSTPSGTNWHRNVIFRNNKVIKKPITAIDMAVKENTDPSTITPHFYPRPLPEKLWEGLKNDCLNGGNTVNSDSTRCDVLTIPHNSNLGGGNGTVPPLFFEPVDQKNAATRAAMEPLVEIYQDKGSSECRFDPRFKSGTQTSDELCNFELLDTNNVLSAVGSGNGSQAVLKPSDFNRNSYVRNVWKNGLQLAQRKFNGVNPFKMGVVSGADSHTGALGWHPENKEWPGHLGIEDAIPTRSSSTIQNSSGGFSVTWSEENSRDSIFAALQRKETYGTSGTRPVVRFFGGWNFPKNLCSTDFVKYGYEKGVPMGGDLPTKPHGKSKGPTFVAAAWKDNFINTPLQQIDVIKGWIDKHNISHEEVFTIAGQKTKSRGVNNQCEATTSGAAELCTVWQDPNFNASQRAFYYVRVLETPVCRYTTLMCQDNYGLNPLLPDQCNKKLASLAASKNPLNKSKASNGAACCSNETTSTFVQPVIQERAWTSPIWYTP
jgi:hypothetical protein